MAPEDWYQRYGQRASDYRLPQAKTARAALAVTVGADGFALLDAVHTADAPPWLRQVPSVQTLRAVWIQQYYRDRQGLRWRGKGRGATRRAGAIDSPYDTDARYGVKRGVGCRGYKAHLTETCEPDRPHLIVHVRPRWPPPPTWTPCPLVMPTSPALTCYPTSIWSMRPLSG